MEKWSCLVSAEVKEKNMTLQGRLQDYFVPHSSKVKVISSLFELDINASQACLSICPEPEPGRGLEH